MIMWDFPILAFVRNFISITGFSLLFLVLDQPKFSWKKTIIYHMMFVTAYAVTGSLWMLWSPDSYVKWFTFTIFAGATLLFPRMSSDTLLQSIYNISVQMFVHTLQLVVGIGISRAVFHANPWAEIVVMCLYLTIAAWLYLCLLRTPYRELAVALRDCFQSFSIVSIMGCLFLILYWTRPTFLMARPFSDQLLYICIWGLFLMTHLMMLRNMSSMYRELAAENKVSLVEMSNHLLGQQLFMLEDSVEEARRIRHDMRHHNMQIAQYVQRGCKDELLHYLGEYEKEAESNAAVTICENKVVDSILIAFLKKAKNHGIAVRLDVTLEKNVGISDIDLVAMIANLMENAIHGCIHSKKQEPFIELHIGRKSSKLVIYARNTAGDDILFENGIPNSKTGDSIGVSSILRSAKRYGGEYDFRVENGVFSCQLLLKAFGTSGDRFIG